MTGGGVLSEASYTPYTPMFVTVSPERCKNILQEKKDGNHQGGVTSMPPVVPFAFTIKILDDQEITDNCRRAQIYNDIHIITRKYTDMYRENGRFDRRKLALIP